MRMRSLLIAAPAAIASVGLAFAISTGAMAGDPRQISNSQMSDTGSLIAQAPPPAPPPGPRAAGDRHERPAFSPRAMCLDRVAHRAGFRAYLKVKLELKPDQMTAWSTFEKAADDAAAKQTARCAAMPSEAKTPPTFTERLSMREDAMKARLDSMEAVKPSMLALYNVLTPEQKVVLDRPFMGRGDHEHGHMRGHGHGPR